jgi:hypothetical protein
MLERPTYENGSKWYGLGLNVTDSGESWGHTGSMPAGTHSSVFRHHSGLTWVVLFSGGRSGIQNLSIDLDAMMKHALSMTQRFSSYSTLLLNQLTFLSMESVHYGVYSAGMDHVYEILLPYEKLDEHYDNLKAAGFYIRHIDLICNDAKLYVNIIWKKNEKNFDWFIRKYDVDNRRYGSLNTVEKDVEEILSSRHQIQTLATCSAKRSLHCVVVFRERSNLNLYYKFFFCTTVHRVNQYVTESGGRVIVQSLCPYVHDTLLTTVVEREVGVIRRPNRFCIAIDLNDFLTCLKSGDPNSGILQFQFYYNYYSNDVKVSYVSSRDVKRRVICRWGFTRYAFMKTLMETARSDMVVENISAYVCRGNFYFACMTVDREAVYEWVEK